MSSHIPRRSILVYSSCILGLTGFSDTMQEWTRISICMISQNSLVELRFALVGVSFCKNGVCEKRFFVNR